ncbi:SIR2 family protein [Roseicyclus sp. F158]|uniref:SIR2 family protein n=1 Tax=Tropicimonas omnivorans TaxID=3075590 RepID=A0ABU3DKB5_9RHOB|nr:SIR2 family protein [Roseicyclus sp. F158]MDT0684158.1 SIR2 family protein [Roseicyclus sp. F158]
MPLRFSEEGPEFPSSLVDALLRGEVVFLCGAGISAPQLPGFKALVDNCYEELNLDKDRSEHLSYETGTFEEVLGSLSRRIVDPDELIRTVSDLVKLPETPDLTRHRTILRLSRDLENRPTIVTTNFDTLIEHAWLLEDVPAETVARSSSAGQALPLPGSSGFQGIIHIHGRIGDPVIGVDQSALVMTSADYGDAYMRSGWVSRFLFDLCRCKTVVLIGYSANDAPVRYFLNVLEADRTRFPDLRTVYALDAIRDNEEDTTARWAALAVEALPYHPVTDPDGQPQSHTALWRDLASLADLIETPKATRRRWTSDLLAKPHASATQAELDWIAWLFTGRRDLFDLVINVVRDSAWLDFFAERKLWTDQDADWVSAAWAGKDLRSKGRFAAALMWNAKLGGDFREQLALKLGQVQDLPDPWYLAWRLMATSKPQRFDWDERSYAVQRELASAPVLYTDLQKAVRLLSPNLVLEPNRSELYGSPAPDTPERLSDLAWVRLTLPDRGGAVALLDALLRQPQPLVLIELATAALRDAIGLGIDAGMVTADFDRIDAGVPSIEAHSQNEHRGGVVFLTELLARLLPTVLASDVKVARRHAEEWQSMPGRVGLRLWMHALRDRSLYHSTDAIEGLLDLSLDDFWRTHRELALAVRDRAGNADQEVVAALEHRIRTEARLHYQRYEIEDGQPDWRDYARDQEVWFRLNMLADAGVLSGEGADELAAIIARHLHLDREVADRDFFKSYSSGVRRVVGDATVIAEAPDNDRLRVAQESLTSHVIEKQQGWHAFCQSNPDGALEILNDAPLDEVNAPLWSKLASVLAHGSGLADEHRQTLTLSIFRTLDAADNQFLVRIIPSLADLYWSTPRRADNAISAWWPKLFQAAVALDCTEVEEDRDIVYRALNSPTGRLTDAMLVELDEQRKAGGTASQALIGNLTTVVSAPGYSGILAKTSLVQNLNFTLSFNVTEVNESLVVALGEDGWEAHALRKVLVSHSRLSPLAMRMFGQSIVKGAASMDSDEGAYWAALNLLSPVLDVVRRGEEAEISGIGAKDVAAGLREGSLALREGAVEVMAGWIEQAEEGAGASWRTAICPLMARVWPRERRFKHPRLSRKFANLAVAAGAAFPEALIFLKPYITPLEGYSGTYEINASTAPDDYPAETLTLLWILLGPDSQATSHDVPKLLDRLISADPKLERDRRLQWLEQRYIRYQ